MKKILSATLSLLLLAASFSGCASDENTTTNANEGNATTQASVTPENDITQAAGADVSEENETVGVLAPDNAETVSATE